MVGLLILVVAIAAITKTASRRGGRSFTWAFFSLAGYFSALYFGTFIFDPESSSYTLFLAWGWLAFCLAAAYYVSGGFKSPSMSWQCPTCAMRNESSTLKCRCGEYYENALTQI